MNKFLKEQGDYVLTWNSLQGVHKKWSTFPTVTSKPAFVNKGIYVNKYVTIFAFLCMRKGRRQWHPTPVLLPGKSHGRRSLVGCSPWGRTGLSNFTFTFHFHALEKEMATHSSVLAWRIPGMWEPGGLPSMGSHRVGHDWSDLAVAAEAAWGKKKTLQGHKNLIKHVTRKGWVGKWVDVLETLWGMRWDWVCSPFVFWVFLYTCTCGILKMQKSV